MHALSAIPAKEALPTCDLDAERVSRSAQRRSGDALDREEIVGFVSDGVGAFDSVPGHHPKLSI
jgi:hypothetical protein